MGGVNPFVEMTVNSKEENSYDFCPNYVQEFGLRAGFMDRPSCTKSPLLGTRYNHYTKRLASKFVLFISKLEYIISF